MDAEIIQQLLALNSQFYQTFAEAFSATRQRVQPGVERLMQRIPSQAAILDVGCGNGELARRLAGQGCRGTYVGVDFSPGLLAEARRRNTHPLAARFLQGDLCSSRWAAPLEGQRFTHALAFAVLHHIPAFDTRLQIVRTLWSLLEPGGLFFHSHWHFLNSPRWRARIQPWESVGLCKADLEPNDYLLDWRRGGRGLRYVHVLDAEELRQLAGQSGFTCVETFYSDGKEGNLALYQVWQKQV